MFPTIIQHTRRNLVAYLALLAALTSSGYAATTKLLPANSVGTSRSSTDRCSSKISRAVSFLVALADPEGFRALPA